MVPKFACFFHHNSPRMGWMAEKRARRCDMRLADGTQVTPPAPAILYEWEGEPSGGEESDILAQLRAQEARLEEQTPLLDRLSATLDPGRFIEFEAMAAAALPGDAAPWARGLLFTALLLDSRRFKFRRQGGFAFKARGETEIAERTHRESLSKARQDWLDSVAGWMEQLESGVWKPEDSGEAGEFLAQLRSLLTQEKRSPNWALLARPLGLGNLPPLDAAVRLKTWLDTAGAWPGWPAVWLEWGQVSTVFGGEVLEAAEKLARVAVTRKGRRDYRKIPAYTFDSPQTRDFDDAFSILGAPEGRLTVAIHIAEPSPRLAPGHPVFEEAERRMATAYTLEGIFPMLPECLSNGRFSLIEGAERETFTFEFTLDDAGARLEQIGRGLVKVGRNLTHDEAQALLDEQPDTWGRLAMICAGLRDARAERGAWIPHRREVEIDVSDPQRIAVREKLRGGPTHQMVEELAILYNQEAAVYCSAAGLPGIYRVQLGAVPGAEDTGGAPDILPPAAFSTRDGPHEGLGCQRYMQTTSPIRRFPDLVMQRQIAEHAEGGGPAFPDTARLADWCGRADQRMNAYNEVARRIEDDYKRRYLQQNPGLVMKASATGRSQAGLNQVWLETLRMNALTQLPPAARPGDTLRVRVAAVDRERGTVRVTCLD